MVIFTLSGAGGGSQLEQRLLLFEFFVTQKMVRVEGVEPSSHPWEGYIIAVIRHPLTPLIIPYPLKLCYNLLHERTKGTA